MTEEKILAYVCFIEFANLSDCDAGFLDCYLSF